MTEHQNDMTSKLVAYLSRLPLFLYLFLSSLALAQTPGTVVAENQLKSLLHHQHALGCDNVQDSLQAVLCAGEIRIGVRTTYKAFGNKVGDELVGFEIDYAKYIAATLGVKPVFIPVTASDRIRMLVDGKADLILATMAHTPERERVVHFIRPHYYSSPTAVAGLKERSISGISDLENTSLCVPLGSYSNIAFTQAQARILMFDQPQKMFDALRFGACNLVAHDRSLILVEVTGEMAPPLMRQRYEEKFSFNEIPWGMAVRHQDASTLGRAVALITAQAHGLGLLEELATKQGVQSPFLKVQRETWANSNCFLIGGELSPICLIEATALGDPPSAIGPFVERLQTWIEQTFHIRVRLPMLSGEEGLRLFLSGILVSILLVLGAITSTVAFGLTFYLLSQARWGAVRVFSNVVCAISLNSPVILLLVLAYLLVSGVFLYTGTVAVIAAIIAIGLNNGAAAGDSLVQARKTLSGGSGFLDAARVCAIQFRACVINAAKASPVAAFIGTPELLSVLTDITSFSGERVVTFTLLALFYLLMVQLVIMLSAWTVQWLAQTEPRNTHA
jgi:polar amino acid transport system substrate-binding protein